MRSLKEAEIDAVGLVSIFARRVSLTSSLHSAMMSINFLVRSSAVEQAFSKAVSDLPGAARAALPLSSRHAS